MSRLVRAPFLAVLRLYYPDRRVRGARPKEGPCIVVANHPNGLLDPVLIMIALDQPMAFLAKSTIFEMPVIRGIATAFRAIPVYRAKEADPKKNAETFAQARALLGRGGWLCLFPEGVSHSAPTLQPLKTGAARIALGGPPGVRIVPVGLTYADKAIFRSAVSLSLGPALAVDAFRHHGGEHPDDVDALTQAIDQALRAQLLEAETREVGEGFRVVAGWLAAPGEDPRITEDRALLYARRWATLAEPEREALGSAARAFAARLREVGVDEPWVLERGLPGPGRVLRAALPLVLLAPLALLGAVLGWVPYRSIRPLVAWATQEEDLVSTYKLLAGVLLMPVWWLAQALLLGLYNPWLGLTALLAGPLTGYVALRWDERWQRRRTLGRAWWLLWSAAGVAEAVRQERATLAARVQAALG